MYHQDEPTTARREKARLNAEEALRLQPNLPEGHLALGFSYYYCDRDYERALTEFEIAKRDLPNEAEAYLAIGGIQRRQGKWAESTANFEKSVSLDPKNANVLFNLAMNYIAQRDFEAADKILDQALVVEPRSFVSRRMKVALPIIWKGDVGLAENQLDLLPPGYDPDGFVTSARVWVLILQRKFAAALQVVQQFRGETLKYPDFGLYPKALLEGILYLYQGDKMKAQAAFEHARTVAEQLVRDAPGDPYRHTSVRRCSCGLGQKEDAINEGKKAVELLPESEDAVDAPKTTAELAEIYAWVGEHDEAFRLLDHLLAVPNGLTCRYSSLIQPGTLCETIRASKNSAKINSRELLRFLRRIKTLAPRHGCNLAQANATFRPANFEMSELWRRGRGNTRWRARLHVLFIVRRNRQRRRSGERFNPNVFGAALFLNLSD